MIRKVKKRYRYKPPKPEPPKQYRSTWRQTITGRLYLEVKEI